jgi:ABC-2 type transport system permease protein
MVLIISAMLSTIYAIGSELRYASSLSWIESAKGSLLAALVGKLAPSTLALWLLSITTAIVVFGLYDTPMRGAWWMLALGCMVLILAYQSVAIFIVALTASFRLSLSLGGGYSVLAFTFSGVTFPTMAMFSAVQPLTALFPYTYFMKLYIDQAVRGVEWWYSMTDIAAMLLFCLLPILALPRLWRVVTENRFWCRL